MPSNTLTKQTFTGIVPTVHGQGSYFKHLVYETYTGESWLVVAVIKRLCYLNILKNNGQRNY